ncbi:glutamate receptor ionotropic, delta-2-like [Penaeus japonicus]|uniref:glutamate receptor ionotropic, delta-2-like n=1 Tax=Penaeus japonicus TaxID=27405 RepID=UPI001C70C38E|nr:glutamate receptor ionotropic, delta-2-like [Penaeus japonicus]
MLDRRNSLVRILVFSVVLAQQVRGQEQTTTISNNTSQDEGPLTKLSEPTASTLETANPEVSTANPEASTTNPEGPTVKPEVSTANPEARNANLQPTTVPSSVPLPNNGSLGVMDSLLQRLGFAFNRGRSSLNDNGDLRPWEQRTVLAELVSYMVSSGTARQIHLLHDLSAPDISPTVQAINQRWGEVTVLTYDDDLTLLESIIRSYYHVEEMRNVVVICSTENTMAVFETIRARNLETPTVQWYVILLDDAITELSGLIREGTQVSVAVKKSMMSYNLAISFINKDNKPKFRAIGSWRWVRGGGGASAFVSESLTPDLNQLYSDFGGRQLKGAVVDNWPFFKVTLLDTYDGTYQEAKPHSGIDCNVINSIADKLNFTYKLLLEPDEGWGGPQPDGTVTGMIGMVARRETDFAIDEITITGPRETVVDFTKPYFLESTTMLSPAPAEKSRAGAIFSPFTPLVWAVLVLATLLIGPILAGISWVMGLYLYEKPDCSIQKYAFHMFRNLVVQSNLIISPHWPHRFIFFFWYLFSFYIYALYSGTLTAVLAVPSFEKPIDSLFDMLEAMKENGFQPLINYGTTNEFILREATSGIYKEIWDLFDPEVGYVRNVDTGVNRVLTGKFAFMNAWLASEIRINKLGKHKYYMARNTYYPQGYGMVLNSGAPYKKLFERSLTQLTESGLVSKWTRDEVQKVEGQGAGDGAGDDDDGGSRGGPGAITLMHLQAAFFMLGMGHFLASLILLSERMLCHPGRTSKPRFEMIITSPRNTP